MLQLFLDQRKPFEPMFERARFIIENQINESSKSFASKDEVLKRVEMLLMKHTQDYLDLIQNIPGFIDLLDLNDVVSLAQDNLCFIFGLKVTHLFINNEFYAVIEDFQLSKKWMELLLGSEMAKRVFEFHESLNNLNLTDQEIALLIPILLTSPSNFKRIFI